MDPETLNRLKASHDELAKVCQAFMTVILENNLTHKSDPLLLGLEVEPGFALRAISVQREIAWEARREAANAGN